MTIQCYSSFQTIKYERKCWHQSVHTQLLGDLGGLNPQGGEGGLPPLKFFKIIACSDAGNSTTSGGQQLRFSLIAGWQNMLAIMAKKYQSNLTLLMCCWIGESQEVWVPSDFEHICKVARDALPFTHFFDQVMIYFSPIKWSRFFSQSVLTSISLRLS